MAFSSCKEEKKVVNDNEITTIPTETKYQENENLSEISNTNERHENPLDFIPKGYVLYTYDGGVSASGWKNITGDLNKDGKKDVVLIIKAISKSNIFQDEYRGELDRNRRGIIVLINKGNFYESISQNLNCFSSENEDGGVYFAPELGVEILKGNLKITYAHGRYGYWNYTFRFQNKDMELIGYDSYQSRGPIPQSEESINFLTKKKLFRDNLNKDDDNDNYVEKYKDTWTTFTIDKLLKLSEIDDFDELELNY